MWIERDALMDIFSTLENENNIEKIKCPCCGKQEIHILFHKADSMTGRGTAWIWCGECKSYIHFSCRVPEWYENANFVDVKKLDAFPDYPNSLCNDIDNWFHYLSEKKKEDEAQ